MKKLINLTKNLPRFFVLLIDFFIVLLCFSLAYFINKEFQFPLILRGHFFVYTITYSACSLVVFYFMNIHSGVIRYTNISDMIRIFVAILLTSVLYAFADRFIVRGMFEIDSLNTAHIIIINFCISFTALIVARIGVRGFFHLIRRTHNDETERILIYGADMNSIMIKQVLDSSNDSKYHVVGFLGTNETSRGGSVHIQQKKVFAVNELTKLKNKYRVTNLIITNDDLSASHKKMVLDKCFDLGIKIMTVPPSSQWIYGRLRLRQIQDLKIEDLLQREPIKISDVHIFEELSGKRVLVTGAGGSIGSEIVRQILRYHPSTLVLCDQAESDLYDIQLEAEEDYPHINIKTHIASIRNLTRMHVPFREFRPQFVFHAAAYKHVPMMENHPSEAILTNVLGTKHIAELSMQYKVQKFVMISTDKAVNPTNIMGASKRIAEMFVQSLNDPDDPLSTKFMTTRFGNVLDSNGSVIPRFRSQIQNGGPVTVTHPDIVRYFMTIPEAVQLVLEACAMGKGGEIFIFDMGKPVRIYDLATNMIKLAGLIPGKDIDIQITGLRPGEKLFEELLNDGEKTIPTHHDKIKIARVITYPKEKVHGNIMELLGISRRDESNALVRKMKEIVPEFKSKNSPYEILDVPVHG